MKHRTHLRPKRVAGFRLLFSIMLLLVFSLLLTACGSSEEEEAVPTQVATLAAEPAVEPTAETEPTPAPEATATSEPVAEVSETAEITETTAMTETAESAAEEAVEPRVFFLQPTDHAVIPLTSTVKMGVEGLTVQPSGEIAEGSGHLHIMVDSPFVAAGEVIPKDETHLHFGDGALEAELSLAPGPHILRLQFADGAHFALEGEQYQHEIAVNVVEGAPEQAVRFVMPTDGATTPPTVDLIWAATGLVVEPSGEIRDGAGHLHVLVDTDFVAPGEVIPKDEQNVHFGGGQLMGTLELEPGDHVLRLQMADGAHFALDGDQYRAEMAIIVAEDAPAAQVMFVEPVDGATVEPELAVKWAATGLIIEPAGPIIAEDRGHLHVLVDADFIPAGEVVPKDETHIHFGGGQTAADLTLEPGEHTLRLQMANGAHIAMEGDQYRDEITVTVEE